ncbi:MAG: Rieske (2Fe-2S) protein [Rhodospirillales bacterium]
MSEHRLCALTGIADGGSAGFEIVESGRSVRLLAVRRGETVYVYENRCPHRRLPLDFKAGQFLDAEKKHILCTNHIALFRIEDGFCIDGPCQGERLRAIPAAVHGDDVFVTL